MLSKLEALLEAGQSVWLDYIRRDLLDSGELQGLVAEGIRGLTSNPTIFQKAIAGTDLYDDEIRHHAGEPPERIFEALAVADIRAAADVLADVHRDSSGRDGFVSLEVSPVLADDAERTIAEARRLWGLVDRPNLMIKVPATDAGVVALERLIAEGINVNATLMFSLAHYEAIAGAYIRGIEHAADPSAVASVASFFVSRVDTKTDAALEKVGTPEALALRGTIAVANAKVTYRRYRELFEGPPFAGAADRGAAPQRPLWASTSTKNPAYSDVLYVESLIGPNTVNTLPPATFDAFVDHGRVIPNALTEGVDDADRRLAALADLGIDFDEITQQLQIEGVAAFAASFDELLRAIADKQARLAR